MNLSTYSNMTYMVQQKRKLRFKVYNFSDEQQNTAYVQIFEARNFRGLLFPNSFVAQEFRVYRILKFRELNFCGLLGSAKTAKITRLENLDVYGMSIFSNHANLLLQFGFISSKNRTSNQNS